MWHPHFPRCIEHGRLAFCRNKYLHQKVCRSLILAAGEAARKQPRPQLGEFPAEQVSSDFDRFELLDVARKMAASAGGVDAALDAVGQLDDEFEVDSLQLTSEALGDLSKAILSTDDKIRVAGEMLGTAGLAVESDRYQLAVPLLEQAASTARAARDFKLAKSAAEQLDEANQLKSQFDLIQVHLKADPDDTAANQAVGEYYCLSKGQWDTGLSYLAKGTDEQFKSLA